MESNVENFMRSSSSAFWPSYGSLKFAPKPASLRCSMVRENRTTSNHHFFAPGAEGAEHF